MHLKFGDTFDLSLPGVRTLVTYGLLAAVIGSGLMGLQDNENLALVRELAKDVVLFYFARQTVVSDKPAA